MRIPRQILMSDESDFESLLPYAGLGGLVACCLSIELMTFESLTVKSITDSTQFHTLARLS